MIEGWQIERIYVDRIALRSGTASLDVPIGKPAPDAAPSRAVPPRAPARRAGQDG